MRPPEYSFVFLYMDRVTGVEPAFSSITLLNVRSVGGYTRIKF